MWDGEEEEDDKVCHTRAEYRAGRRERAVRVYTVNEESRYLMVRNVPALGCVGDLLRLFSAHGPIEEHRMMDEEDAPPFTDVVWLKFTHLHHARFAKRKLDEYPFMGSALKVSFLPGHETMEDTWAKLEERRRIVAVRCRPNHALMLETVLSCMLPHCWAPPLPLSSTIPTLAPHSRLQPTQPHQQAAQPHQQAAQPHQQAAQPHQQAAQPQQHVAAGSSSSAVNIDTSSDVIPAASSRQPGSTSPTSSTTLATSDSSPAPRAPCYFGVASMDAAVARVRSHLAALHAPPHPHATPPSQAGTVRDCAASEHGTGSAHEHGLCDTQHIHASREAHDRCTASLAQGTAGGESAGVGGGDACGAEAALTMVQPPGLVHQTHVQCVPRNGANEGAVVLGLAEVYIADEIHASNHNPTKDRGAVGIHPIASHPILFDVHPTDTSLPAGKSAMPGPPCRPTARRPRNCVVIAVETDRLLSSRCARACALIVIAASLLPSLSFAAESAEKTRRVSSESRKSNSSGSSCRPRPSISTARSPASPVPPRLSSLLSFLLSFCQIALIPCGGRSACIGGRAESHRPLAASAYHPSASHASLSHHITPPP
ncbi:unnamed protein product [Closterium sp. Yama58-4]|nr:unnamed protein product [Closterium sp. Yama58-4]